MSARNQICTCGHSFMDHTPEYNDDCDMCDCFEFEFGYDLTVRPQNGTGKIFMEQMRKVYAGHLKFEMELK